MRRLNLGIGILLILLCAGAIFAQTKTDHFFPDSTKGYISINNMPELRREWRKTELGQIVLSEPFADFRSSVMESLEKNWMGRVGMSIRDTLDIASGEAAFGIVAIPGHTPGMLIAIDVANKKKEAEEFMARLVRQSFDSKSGTSKKETLKIGNNSISVTVMVFPPDKQYPTARTAYYVMVDNFLIATDQRELIQQVLTCKKPLASVEAYTMSMQRCAADFTSAHEPQIRYFINPLEFGKAITLIASSNQKTSDSAPDAQTPFDILANHGLGAITGVGGTIDYASDSMEFVSRAKIYIPEGTKRNDLISFIDEAKLIAPDWIDANVNSATVVNIDLLNLFNKIGPIFDDFVKTENLWEDTLKGLEEDEGGPQVNLKTQLVGNLGSQIATFRRTIDGKESFVGGIKIKPGKDEIIADVFHRMFDTDADFQQIPYGDGTIWYYAPQPKRQSRATRRPAAAAARGQAAKAQAAKNQPAKSPAFIKNAFYVGDGNIFFSNDADALKEVIENKRSGSVSPLENSKTYKIVTDYIQQFSGNGYSVQFYSANHNGIKTNYNLIRDGKFLEGNTIASRCFQKIYPDKNVKSPILENGHKLPPFETIEERLGAIGAFGKNESDGFFIKGFGLGPNLIR